MVEDAPAYLFTYVRLRLIQTAVAHYKSQLGSFVTHTAHYANTHSTTEPNHPSLYHLPVVQFCLTRLNACTSFILWIKTETTGPTRVAWNKGRIWAPSLCFSYTLSYIYIIFFFFVLVFTGLLEDAESSKVYPLHTHALAGKKRAEVSRRQDSWTQDCRTSCLSVKTASLSRAPEYGIRCIPVYGIRKIRMKELPEPRIWDARLKGVRGWWGTDRK